MSMQHFSTSDHAKLATGMGRAELSRIAWADLSALRGIVRTRVLTDLERFGLPCHVRLNPEAWQRFNKRQPIRFEAGEIHSVVLTDEWQAVPASAAILIETRRHEDATLGAATMKMEMQSDGYGGKFLNPVPVAACEDLIEFAAPADRAKTLIVASS